MESQETCLWIHALKSKAIGIKFKFNYEEHSQKIKVREMRLQRYMSGSTRKDIIRNKRTHEVEVPQLRTRRVKSSKVIQSMKHL